MENKLEIVYYQMIKLEERLDKKIEYIENTEKSIEKSVLILEEILKSLKK